MFWRSLPLAGIVIVLGSCAASATSRPPDSGVRGRVLYGPTCPVQRPGQTCERPYRATLVFRREPGNRLALRLRTAADGRFTAHLTPGRYRLEPRNGNPYPQARSVTVSVHPGSFTRVTVRYDSGIR